MSSLYLNESGAVVSVEGGYFVVKQKDGLTRKMPRELLESITIFGNSTITTPCLQECLRRGVAVNYFTGRGAYYGRLSSTRHVNPERLRRQVYACDDPAFCLVLSRKIVAAKIHNQGVLLSRYQRNSEKIAETYLAAIKVLEPKLAGTSSVEELMGYEGIAARNYFAALSRLIVPEFSFQGRTRQPPRAIQENSATKESAPVRLAQGGGRSLADARQGRQRSDRCAGVLELLQHFLGLL